MRICQEFEVACGADAAWEAVHDPGVAVQSYEPLVGDAVTTRQPSRSVPVGRPVRVTLRLFGRVLLGSQSIAIEDHRPSGERGHGRLTRDAGCPLTGPSPS